MAGRASDEPVPEWAWKIAAVAGAAAAAIYVASGIVGGAAPPADAPGGFRVDTSSVADEVSAVPQPSASQAPTAPSSAPSVPPPAAEDSVPLPGPAGSSIEAPVAALEVARAAVTALYTGGFEDVPTAPDARVPETLPEVYEDPEVGRPQVVSVGEGVYTFRFFVDPDRSGPAPARLKDVHVARSPEGGWWWLGV